MNKLHLMFSVCEKYHSERTIPLYNTVCKQALKYNYDISLIGGFINTIDDIPIKRLVADDTYESAIDKNLTGILYHSKENTEFDFYMICDDDTFINFRRLNTLLDTIDKEKLALYGCVGPINGDGRLHVTGGPGILMNRKTFNTLADIISRFYIKHQVHSDVAVSLNAHKFNDLSDGDKIDFINLDEFLHPHKPLFSIKDVTTYHLSGKNSYFDLQNELLS